MAPQKEKARRPVFGSFLQAGAADAPACPRQLGGAGAAGISPSGPGAAAPGSLQDAACHGFVSGDSAADGAGVGGCVIDRKLGWLGGSGSLRGGSGLLETDSGASPWLMSHR